MAGNARFQVLTTGLVRLEYAPDGTFEDRPTMTALDWEFDVPAFETRLEDGIRHLETDRVRLAYEVGNGPFDDENLSVEEPPISSLRSWCFSPTETPGALWIERGGAVWRAHTSHRTRSNPSSPPWVNVT